MSGMVRGFPVELPTVRIYAGDTFQRRLRFIDDGEVADLSGWAGWAAAWRSDRAGAEPVALTVSPDSGEIRVSASRVITRLMVGHGVIDVQATRGGQSRTWVRFKTVFEEDATL